MLTKLNSNALNPGNENDKHVNKIVKENDLVLTKYLYYYTFLPTYNNLNQIFVKIQYLKVYVKSTKKTFMYSGILH